MKLPWLLFVGTALAQQSPFSISHADTDPNAAPSLLSAEVYDYIEHLRTRWGVEGISIGLIASPNATQLPTPTSLSCNVRIDEDGWKRETVHFGTANRFGDAVDGDVSTAIISRLSYSILG